MQQNIYYSSKVAVKRYYNNHTKSAYPFLLETEEKDVDSKNESDEQNTNEASGSIPVINNAFWQSKMTICWTMMYYLEILKRDNSFIMNNSIKSLI